MIHIGLRLSDLSWEWTRRHEGLSPSKPAICMFSPEPRIFTKDWLINGLEYRFRRTNRQVEFFIKKNNIDIIFGYCIAYSCGSVPVLSWIPDFQHKHMPDLFSKSARRARDKNFARIAKNAKRVVCMSNAVQDDFITFFPRYKDKSFVLRSAADIEEEVFSIDPAKVAAHYSLPERFIFVPNQFWKHKNHECVFKALHILKKKRERLFVVFSGHENDYRDPEYFPSLMAYAHKAGLEEMFISLGIIDYADVLQLMRQSICVLNPSLFEGFGLSVEEAKAVGKKAIVSDIPVFREHNAPEAVFFDPKSPAELAQKMLLVGIQVMRGPTLYWKKK